MRLRILLISAALTGSLAGCADRAPVASEIPSPAGPGSAQPNLAAGPNQTAYLSWIENTADGVRRFQFAEWNGAEWSGTRGIVEGSNLLVNWADFPSLVLFHDSRLAAHWLSRTPESGAGYSVNVAVSSDQGQTWSLPLTPHRDETPTEHGFVSFAPAGNGEISALWLDARKLAVPGSDDVALMNTLVGGMEGSLGEERVVDERVCECCAPSSVAVGRQIFAVYRDRTADEIRDIVLVRYRDGNWSEPRLVFADNWKIFACPINGPAIAASDTHLAVAWFTAAGGKPKVQVAFSEDGGESFNPPVVADDGNPVGRVDITMLPDNVAVVTWIEHSPAGGQVRARFIEPVGNARPSVIVAPTSIGTASGFPRVERSGDSVIVAWTDTAEKRVKTAMLR